MVVHTIAPPSLRVEAEGAERVWGQLVSGNYFDVLGVRAVRGRTFLPDEERQAAQVVVLSQSYWRRKFKSDPGVVGRRVALNGQGFTIVGIASSGFGGSQLGFGMDRRALAPGAPAPGGERDAGPRRRSPGVAARAGRAEGPGGGPPGPAVPHQPGEPAFRAGHWRDVRPNASDGPALRASARPSGHHR